MSVFAVKPPPWVWPARIVGLSALLLGLFLPGEYLWWRSVAGMPTAQVVEVKDLRPTMLVLPAQNVPDSSRGTLLKCRKRTVPNNPFGATTVAPVVITMPTELGI